MEKMNNDFLISPSILAIGGLVMFILAQFLGIKIRIALSILGLMLIGVFFYKLKSVENDLLSAYMEPGTKQIRFTSGDIYTIIIGVNMISLFFWVWGTLKIAFSAIPYPDKKIALACSVIVMATNFLIYKIFGQTICILCFPVLSLGFFAAVDNNFANIIQSKPIKQQ